MSNAFGLTAEETKQIQTVFMGYPTITSVKIFGSRAMGNYHPSSDIDLAYYGLITPQQEYSLYHKLDALPLPYQFDIQAYDTITHLPLREHIDHVGKLLYQRTPL